jgi:hypothetical protein
MTAAPAQMARDLDLNAETYARGGNLHYLKSQTHHDAKR